MKRFLFVVWIYMIPLPAGAQHKGIGVGIMLGEPTGISFKNWHGSHSAVDGGVAWSFEKRASLHLHLDYLVHEFGFFALERGRLPFYYGIGGRIRFESDVKVGARIPLGLNYIFAQDPLDLFVEVVPTLDLVPSTVLDINGGVGIRYFFR